MQRGSETARCLYLCAAPEGFPPLPPPLRMGEGRFMSVSCLNWKQLGCGVSSALVVVRVEFLSSLKKKGATLDSVHLFS